MRNFVMFCFSIMLSASLQAQIDGELFQQPVGVDAFFQSDSLSIDVCDSVVTVIRGGEIRLLKPNSIEMGQDRIIINFNDAQYIVDECWVVILPPLFSATLQEQTRMCEKHPVKMYTRNGLESVYADPNVDRLDFRVENIGGRYRRIWIDTEDQREYDFFPKLSSN